MLIPTYPMQGKGSGKRLRVKRVLELLAYYAGVDDINEVMLLLCKFVGVPSPAAGEKGSLPAEVELKDKKGRVVMRMVLRSGRGGEEPNIQYYLPSRLDIFDNTGESAHFLSEITKTYLKVAKKLGFRVDLVPPLLRKFLSFVAAFNAQYAEGGEK